MANVDQHQYYQQPASIISPQQMVFEELTPEQLMQLQQQRPLPDPSISSNNNSEQVYYQPVYTVMPVNYQEPRQRQVQFSNNDHYQQQQQQHSYFDSNIGMFYHSNSPTKQAQIIDPLPDDIPKPQHDPSKIRHLIVASNERLRRASLFSLGDRRQSLRKHYAHLMDKVKKSINKRTRFRNLGIIFLFGGIFNMIFYQSIHNYLLKDLIFPLNPNNLAFKMYWYFLPIPLYTDIYLWDLKNPKQFLDGAKPHMKELGPFVFETYRKRRVLEWTDETVIFKERFFANYRADLSPYPLDKKITTINSVMIAVTGFAYNLLDKFYVKFLNTIVHNVLAIAMQTSGETLIETRTVDEVLNGRKVNLLKFVDAIMQPIRASNLPIPDIGDFVNNFGNYKIVNSSFGIMGLLMANEFGPLEHYRHVADGHKVGEVKTILGSPNWNDLYKPPCSKVGGLDPLHFGINDQGETFEIYFQHFCRRLPFRKNTTHWYRGIYAVRYEIFPWMFDMRQPENQCYCFSGRSFAECDGHVDMSGCYGGLPVAISMRHFWKSPRLQRQVIGVEPDYAEHVTDLEMEPMTGIPFDARLNFQVNLVMKNFPRLAQLGKVRPTIMPFFGFKIRLQTNAYTHPPFMILAFLLTYEKYLITMGAFLLSMFYFYRYFNYGKIGPINKVLR